MSESRGIAEQGEATVFTIGVVDNDIETLASALYVKVDDMLTDWPELAPHRPDAAPQAPP